MSNESSSEPTGLQDFSLQPEDNDSTVKLDAMSVQELLDLHARIESKLGGLAITEVNLVKETLLQIRRAKELQEKASTDKGVPMNQRAQVQNSLGNMLVQLGKMQSELFNSERIKRIQQATIKVVKRMPKEYQDQFFELLEHELDVAAQETDDVEVVK